MAEAEEDCYVVEEEVTAIPGWAPSVTLDVKDDVETGEEGEEELYSQRSKLYRFRDGEWKERGRGDARLLLHKESGKVRFMLRQEKTMKIVANQYVVEYKPYYELTPNAGSDKCWVWTAQDFSEEDPVYEQFALKFGSPELASAFKEAFDNAKVLNSKVKDFDNLTNGGAGSTAEVERPQEAPEPKPAAEEENAAEEKAASNPFAGVSLFSGASGAAPQSAASAGSLFGGTSEGGGGAAGGGLFGTGPGIFSGAATGGLFAGSGGSAGGLFGSSSASSGGGLFSSISGSHFASSSGGSGGGLFGASAASSGSLFAPPSRAGEGGIFGSAAAAGDAARPAAAQASEGKVAAEGEEEYVAEEEVTAIPGWTPSITLEVKDAVESGEEQEDEIYSQRSKLYRFVDGEWKERGLGEAKLMKHKETGKVRFMLRQEKTLKIVANHYVIDHPPYYDLQPNAGSEKCWVWSAQDCADEELKNEKFALKFGTPELATKFKEAFDDAKKLNAKVQEFSDVTAGATGAAPAEAAASGSGSSTTAAKEPATSAKPASSGGGLFGAALSGSSSGGATSGGSSGGGLFGGSSSGGGLFGASSGGSLFGASSSGGGLFSGSSSGGLFGSSSGGGLFGNSSSTGGLFGSTSSSGGLFGSSSSGGGLFSSAASSGSASSGGGLFGSLAASGQATTSSAPEAPAASGAGGEGEEEYVEEEVTLIPGWSPSVNLELLSKVDTGEEQEEELYTQRSKLYRFRDGEWKERGLGEAKLLKHKETGKVRFMLRQEKTMKIMANHFVVGVAPYCDLQPNAGSEKCWVWMAQDCSDEEPSSERLALKFGSPEVAQKFKEAFENAKELNAKVREFADMIAGSAKGEAAAMPNPAGAEKEKPPAAAQEQKPTSSLFGNAGAAASSGSAMVANPFAGVSISSTTPEVSGTAATSGSLFGLASASSGGLFGSSSSGGLFGSSSGGLFGGGASSGGGLFGSAASSGGGLFGGGAASSSASSGGGKLLGGEAASSSGGLFGTPAASTGSLFGSSASSGSLFGSASSGGSLFGASAPSSGGLFGATSSAGGLFGGSTSSGGLFGSALSAPSSSGLFSSASASSGGAEVAAATAGAEAGQEVELVPEEEITEIQGWTPSVNLKVLDKVESGEEHEQEIYSQRSKLYRYRDGDWKERGTGEAKLLKHGETGKVRFLLRQEKTLKIVANHYVIDQAPYCELRPNAGSAKCWVWTAPDCADGDPEVEQFALKFASPELASKFEESFNSAKRTNASSSAKALGATAKVAPKPSVAPPQQQQEEEEEEDEEEDGYEEVEEDYDDGAKFPPSAASGADAFKLLAQQQQSGWRCPGCRLQWPENVYECQVCEISRPGFEDKVKEEKAKKDQGKVDAAAAFLGASTAAPKEAPSAFASASPLQFGFGVGTSSGSAPAVAAPSIFGSGSAGGIVFGSQPTAPAPPPPASSGSTTFFGNVAPVVVPPPADKPAPVVVPPPAPPPPAAALQSAPMCAPLGAQGVQAVPKMPLVPLPAAGFGLPGALPGSVGMPGMGLQGAGGMMPAGSEQMQMQMQMQSPRQDAAWVAEVVMAAADRARGTTAVEPRPAAEPQGVSEAAFRRSEERMRALEEKLRSQEDHCERAEERARRAEERARRAEDELSSIRPQIEQLLRKQQEDGSLLRSLHQQMTDERLAMECVKRDIKQERESRGSMESSNLAMAETIQKTLQIADTAVKVSEGARQDVAALREERYVVETANTTRQRLEALESASDKHSLEALKSMALPSRIMHLQSLHLQQTGQHLEPLAPKADSAVAASSAAAENGMPTGPLLRHLPAKSC